MTISRSLNETRVRLRKDETYLNHYCISGYVQPYMISKVRGINLEIFYAINRRFSGKSKVTRGTLAP